NTIAEYQMAITSKEHKTGSFFIKNNFEGESWANFIVLQEVDTV
ncbi:hypothetical protein SAMN05216331_101221, partial [Porphyromonadaceae bacterium KH3R12]